MKRFVQSVGVATVLVWAVAVVSLPGSQEDIKIPRVPNPPADVKELPGDLAG